MTSCCIYYLIIDPDAYIPALYRTEGWRQIEGAGNGKCKVPGCRFGRTGDCSHLGASAANECSKGRRDKCDVHKRRGADLAGEVPGMSSGRLDGANVTRDV